MSRQVVFTKDAPPPRAGVNCQAMVAGGLVFCSGNLPADLSGKIIDGDIQAHTVRLVQTSQATYHPALFRCMHGPPRAQQKRRK